LDSTSFIGEYATGILQAGTYNIQYSAPGYITQTFNNVTLSNGVLTAINVALLPIGFSTRDIEDGNSFSIFPNPASNELRIENAALKIEGIEVYDVFGKELFSQISNLKSQISVDTSQLSPGIYFVTITNSEQRKLTKKFVKANYYD
jgi:hypothetical protein